MKQKTLNYTLILHQARKKLGLNLMEYSVADSIYHLSNSPDSKTPGWCRSSKESIAEFLGTSSRTIFSNINKLIKKGLVERNEKTKYLRTTAKWYEAVIFSKNEDYEETSYTMKKLHTNYEETSYNNNKDNNIKKRNIKKRKTPLEEMRIFTGDKSEEQGKLLQSLIEPYLKLGFPRDVILQQLADFRSYWTELTPSGKKQHWQLQKTFELRRRFATWMRNFRNKNFKY